VRTRIFIGVSAWLLGVVTAICGSLLAVSLLGNGFGVSAGQGQQLSTAAVNAALASVPNEHTSAPAAHGSARPPKAPHIRAKHASSPSVTPAAPAQNAQTGTLLASPAGTVVASCEPAGAYLVSWSPAQGYGSDQVLRGPAPEAEVTFDGGTHATTMRVSCRGGVPVAATSWGHDDDGGSGDDGSGASTTDR
jgi:hypothetical protein